jgi:cobalt-precorrin 5A hydrolase / precorrin-3B C17-methyltransferase
MPPSDLSRFVLGVGVSADAQTEDALALSETALVRAALSRETIAAIATIASRRDHPAVLALADRFGCPVHTFDAAVLEAETPRLKNPSDALFARIGCHGVAEAAALAAAGRGAILIVEKTAGRKVTVAIAG